MSEQTVSTVYFTNFQARPGTSVLQKLERLIRAAGIGAIDMEKKMVAIKIHFGEPGNLAYLRPNYAKVVADVVKSLGGMPFLTDCNTLYVGRRKNALDHMDAAYENGFSPFSTGCQIIIVPCIGFGPGAEAQAHAPNEKTWKQDLVTCAAVYAALPETYCE